MIKYLGSKRRLVKVLGALATGCGARSALDLFTGTTRVAQELKQRGLFVTAVDLATYSHAMARCYVETDARTADLDKISRAVADLNRLEGVPGYFTEVFCVESRYLRPENGERVDAIRDEIEARFAGTWLHPVLLTSLLEAADRVDSTAGVQMAYLKNWAPRAFKPLSLRVPELIAGEGRALLGDARSVVGCLDEVDFAYLDPPYNQHRYFTNYHVWETLVRWDSPEHYGIACKRADARSDSTRSDFNSKRTMRAALHDVVKHVRARVVAVSCNDESWIAKDELVGLGQARGPGTHAELLEFESRRYVGAQIGIHDPAGRKVGVVSHLHNTERIAIFGTTSDVQGAIAGLRSEIAGQTAHCGAPVQMALFEK